MKSVEDQIPYVDARKDSGELEKYNLSEHERKVEIAGEKFSLYIVDLRPETQSGEKATDYPIDIYSMPFMENDPVSPNELSAEIIDRTRARGGVLVVPRFEKLPQKPGHDVEARLALIGLESLAAEYAVEGIDFDFSRRDVDIIGFSDGARTALELAGIINNIPQVTSTKRTLRSLSPTAVIDLVDVPDNADGSELIKGFVKQVTWITMEETRLRFNDVLARESKRFNDNLHEKMANGEIEGNERDFYKIGKAEASLRKADGTYEYPLLAKGFKAIPEPEKTFDNRAVARVIASVSKLMSYPEGRKMFAEQFKDSMKINIPFLTDVIVRAVTANPDFNPEDLLGPNFVQSVADLIKVYPNLQSHLLANETRSAVCDNLQTFDVEAVYPVEDVVFPVEAYGRTIRRKLQKNEGFVSYVHHESVAQHVALAMHDKDDELLGFLCAKYPDAFARVLFPRAKSVKIRFEGEAGSLSGTHLAPLKKPENFITSE